MQHASTFDLEKFASILKTEVRDIAEKRFKGTSKVHLGKAFAFWCIHNITPSLDDDDVERARQICESSGSGDEYIDGAWIDDKAKTFFLIQTKYSEPSIPTTDADKFKQDSFGRDAMEQLYLGFEQVVKQASGSPKSPKLRELVKLYNEAKTKSLRVELVAIVSGKPRAFLAHAIRLAKFLGRLMIVRRRYGPVFSLNNRRNTLLSSSTSIRPRDNMGSIMFLTVRTDTLAVLATSATEDPAPCLST